MNINKDDFSLTVYWLKRGHKFTRRATRKPTSSTNTAMLIISNVQPEDLGVYICRARAIQPMRHRHKIVGEQKHHLMATHFYDIDPAEQTLLNPDLTVSSTCRNRMHNCDHIQKNDYLVLKCGVANFGK